MLILILIDVQYSQDAVFSFEKGLNGQKYPPAKFPIYPISNFWLTPICKTLGVISY